MFESSIYSPVVLPVREAQPENKVNPKTTNTAKKTTFFISLLLSLDLQSSDCNVNKSNKGNVIAQNASLKLLLVSLHLLHDFFVFTTPP
jgi:hypothetical protein